MLDGNALISVLDRSKKRIVIALGLAVLMHLPITPMLPVLRLVHRIALKEQLKALPQNPTRPAEVEVQLEQALHQEARHQQQQEQQAAARIEQEPPSQRALSMSPPVNVPFNQATPTPKPVDAEASEKPVEPKKEKLKDIGLEGDLSKKDNLKPGVVLGLWFSSLRDSALGKDFVEVAACDREWRVFIEQGVDLLKDFDGVLVVGQSLFEPGDMTAAVRHSLPKERVHEVVDSLVRRSGRSGRWLKDNVATARLGKAQRMLMPHQDDLFFVTPAKGWEALHSLTQPMRVPQSEGRFMSLVLSQPNNVLRRVGLLLPNRISSLRLEAYANSDLSGDIKVELEDASERAAKEDLKKVSGQLSEFFADTWLLTSTLSSITGSNAPSIGPELAPHLELSVVDSALSGTIHLSPGQIRSTLNLASRMMCRKPKGAVAKKP